MDIRAVIFVPALAGSVIVGFVFLLFAANYYLTILESSGVGSREVVWTSESIADNAPKLAYLAWLIGLWLGPAFFLGRAIASGADAPWLRLAAPLAVFWLCYPVSQLSSLSASTIWLPLVPDVFARLAQKPAIVVEFLLLSAPVLAVFGVGFQWAFLTGGEWGLLLAGAPLVAASGFLYARLIGRLAFALRFTKSLFPDLKERKTKSRSAPGPERTEAPVFVQPSELPPILTPDEGDLHGYDVKFEDDRTARPRKRVKAEAVESDEPKPGTSRASTDHSEEKPAAAEVEGGDWFPPIRPRSRGERRSSPERRREWTEDDEDATAYGVHEPDALPVKETIPESLIRPKEEEMRLLRRDDLPKPAKRIWSGDLLAFFLQERTVSALAIATLLCSGAGVFVRVARAFNPASGGD